MTKHVIKPFDLQIWAETDLQAIKCTHPGFPPLPPQPPGKKASFYLIRWSWYRYQKYRWRNHHKKQSPFWDFYRDVFMKSIYWAIAREMCFRRDGHRCTDRSFGKRCANTIVDGPLQAHHKAYWDRWGRPLVGREQDNLWCLTTVCMECHNRYHTKQRRVKRNKRLRKFWDWLIS